MGDRRRREPQCLGIRGVSRAGESAWRQGLPLVRIGGERVFRQREHLDYTVPDGFAGSILNLQFIETDGGVHNVRVYDNRGVNAAHGGYSAQPVFGGPVYFIRNLLYHVPSGVAFKFSAKPAGLFVWPTQSSASRWRAIRRATCTSATTCSSAATRRTAAS